MAGLPASLAEAAESSATSAPGRQVTAYNPALEWFDTLTVPLFINGSFQQELRVVTPEAEQLLRIDGIVFLEIVRHALLPMTLVLLEKLLDRDGTLTPADMVAAGLDAIFDDLSLQLQVRVPLDLIRPQLLRFRTVELPPEAVNAYRTATFSSFINARGFIESARSTGNPSRQLSFVNFDGAFNTHGFVLEWQANFQDERARPWQRGNIRLVHDQPERRLRTAVGDMIYPATGFQSFVPAGGITYSKNFSLQPYRITQPTVQGAFILERESTVEVIINNQVIRTLRLGPGPYDLRDFPLTAGLNDVRLRILDASGREDILSYPFTLDSRLLAPGEEEFSYAVGFPSRVVNGHYRYDNDTTGFSLFHRYGVNDRLTVGFDLQGNDRQLMGGLETLLATAPGVIDINLAYSEIYNLGLGKAVRLQFRRNNLANDRNWHRNWLFTVEYKDPLFAPLGNLRPLNPARYNFAARFSQRFPGNISLGIGGDYQLARNGYNDTSGFSLYLAKSLRPGVTLGLQMSHRVDIAGNSENSAFFTVEFPVYAQNQRVSLTSNTGDNSSRYNWKYFAPRAVGGIDANMTMERRPDMEQLGGDLLYTGTRGHLAIEHDRIESGSGSGNAGTQSRSILRADTALVFADGKFGLGRPVTNSFALLSPHPVLKGQTIGINPTGNAHEARIDKLGAAVLPVLSPYRLARVRLDAQDIPDGYELGVQSFDVLPDYKSGILVTVGTGATVYIVGNLQDAAGLPLALLAAEIIAADSHDSASVTTFTNRNGRFVAEGLRPGKYLLRVQGVTAQSAQFEIPDRTAGRLDLGTLIISPAGQGALP